LSLAADFSPQWNAAQSGLAMATRLMPGSASAFRPVEISTFGSTDQRNAACRVTQQRAGLAQKGAGRAGRQFQRRVGMRMAGHDIDFFKAIYKPATVAMQRPLAAAGKLTTSATRQSRKRDKGHGMLSQKG
jgi:hypothetical protein